MMEQLKKVDCCFKPLSFEASTIALIAFWGPTIATQAQMLNVWCVYIYIHLYIPIYTFTIKIK